MLTNVLVQAMNAYSSLVSVVCLLFPCYAYSTIQTPTRAGLWNMSDTGVWRQLELVQYCVLVICILQYLHLAHNKNCWPFICKNDLYILCKKKEKKRRKRESELKRIKLSTALELDLVFQSRRQLI